MTEEEYDKKVKGTKMFCIIISLLFVIAFIMNLMQNNIISALLSLAFIGLLYLFYSLTKQKKLAGPIIGIILGTLYILQLNIFTIIIGIFILIDSISMYKFIKK